MKEAEILASIAPISLARRSNNGGVVVCNNHVLQHI